MIFQEPLKASVAFCLQNYAFSDAIFLAERLHSEEGSEASLHLLASCYFQSGKASASYSLLSNHPGTSEKYRFLLARVCMDLKKYAEAEEALLSAFSKFDSRMTSTFTITTRDLVSQYGESASFVAQLLGQINLKTERTTKAIEFFKMSLELNPFLWSSFEALVQLGHPVNADNVFDLSKTNFNLCHGSKVHSPFAIMKTTLESGPADFTPKTMAWAPSATSFAPQKQNAFKNVKKSGQPGGQNQSLRRSSRLFNSQNSLSSVKENAKNTSRNQENNKSSSCIKTPPKKQRRQTSSTMTGPIVSDNKSDDDLKKDVENNYVNHEQLVQTGLKAQRESAEGLMNLLKSMGKAHCHLGNYQLNEAITVLNSLPPKHKSSGWVLSSLGRCYFEQGQYETAVRYFEEARIKEPHRLKGTEYHSTALWHLQQEIKLSMLSQDLIELDRESPQTWCVAGNCFSLQKEHETAIKFLQRAIQVDPEFPYAYTLLGHEYVLTEEMDNAMACFRSAIRIDPRHYNAWYGLGMIYYKQEKYDLAEVHYRKAVDICPPSPILRCHLGIVLHGLKKTQDALSVLDTAIAMNPSNALSRFHRANIYFALDRHEDALKELEELKILIPKESLVHFLIGKVHKRLGNTHLALMNFSWAMDLDPKGTNNQIKEVIDRQYAKDDDEDVVIGVDSLEDSSHHESMDAEEPSF